MKKAVIVMLLACAICSATGCVGSNAVTQKLMKFNLQVVDNRYARGGLNFLLAPVYGVTALADAMVFNAIEFWAGKNPINGKPHIFDSDVKTIFDINDKLDDSLKEAPLGKLGEEGKEVQTITMKPVDENTLEFTITYTDGKTALVLAEREGSLVTFYVDGELRKTMTMARLRSSVTPSA